MESPGAKTSETVAYKVVFLILAIMLALWLLVTLKTLVTCLIIALTLAAAIAPFAEWGEQRKVPRALTVVGLYLAIAGLYVALAMALAPVVRDQANQLYEHIPHYYDSLSEGYNRLVAISGVHLSGSPLKANDIRDMAPRVVTKTVGITANFLGGLVNAVLVLFLTAYFVISANDIWPKLLRWVPPKKRDQVGALIRPLAARMGGYVRGQLLVAICVAVFLGTGLTIIGVNYSLVLGILAGCLNLVPYAGSFITMTFAIIIASNQSLLLGALTIGLFALEQWVESTFFVPQLLGRHVDVHPLLILLGIFIGATLMGLPGALIAVPLTSAGLYLAEEFYLRPLNFTE